MFFVTLFSPIGRLGRLAYIGYSILAGFLGALILLLGLLVGMGALYPARGAFATGDLSTAASTIFHAPDTRSAAIAGLAILALSVLAAWWMLAMITVKRLHDIGVSGLHLLWIVPLQTLEDTKLLPWPMRVIAGLCSLGITLWLLCKRGTEGVNAYGPPPGEYI